MALRDNVLRSDRFTEKERRNLAILDIVRRRRQISRAEISKMTLLNIVTISNYIDDYITKGIIVEKGLDVSSGGRRPELLELNPKYGYAMGIDLGPPHITEDAYVVAVLLDVTGRTIAKAKVKKEEEPQDRLIDKVEDLAEELLSRSKVARDRIKGIGIGIWGVLDRERGMVRYAVEKGGTFSYAALQSALEKEFKVSTLVEHDATAGALGEKWIGLGLESEAEDILYICSDSSCGLILNGEIYYGASKSAGELNINPPSASPSDDACWAKYDYGCGFRSRGIDLGIAERAKRHFEKNPSTSSKMLELAGKDPAKISFGMVIEAARYGDKEAVRLLKEAGDYLGLKVAFLINLFNPDAVVIGRGVERGGDVFMEAVRASLRKWAYEESLKVAKVLTTSLGEDSIACGASALVLQQVFARI